MTDIWKIKRADKDGVWLKTRGVWRRATRAGKITANISCPNCGVVGSLSGHEIDAEGNVTPSVVCSAAQCGFHEFVKLEGWDQ